MSTQFPSRLQAVVFDLDGTLLDTAGEFIQVVHQLRAEHQLGRLPEADIRAQVSNGARALVTLALGLSEGDAEFETQRLRLLEIYSGLLGSSAGPYPGIVELLETLANAGISWGISTNKPRAFTEPLLQRVDLRPEPASVVCADEVNNPKPHPEPLYLNCKQMNCLPANVVYVGDHRRDIQAGRGAGMYTIAAAYGYLLQGDDPVDWGADSIANDGQELAHLIGAAFA
jgi:2-phosphoglycolate phosphatase